MAASQGPAKQHGTQQQACGTARCVHVKSVADISWRLKRITDNEQSNVSVRIAIDREPELFYTSGYRHQSAALLRLVADGVGSMLLD
jgi:hypothetical protein